MNGVKYRFLPLTTAHLKGGRVAIHFGQHLEIARVHFPCPQSVAPELTPGIAIGMFRAIKLPTMRPIPTEYQWHIEWSHAEWVEPVL